MKAVRIVDGALLLAEVPEPLLRAGCVRIGVRACGLNRADLLQRRGRYPAPPPYAQDRPGLELSGQVLACGEGVQGFREGDAVMALLGGEAQSEQVVVDQRLVLPVPAGLGFEEAAAIPEAFATAYDALLLQAELRAGENVLVHAAGSGVGSAAVQLVRFFGGHSFGTSRKAEKLSELRALGLEHGFCTAQGLNSEVVQSIRRASQGVGMHVTLDLAGGQYLRGNVEGAASGGRLLVLGLMSGAMGELDMGTLLQQRLKLWGTTLRSRSVEEKQLLLQSMRSALWAAFEQRQLRAVIGRVLPMSQVEQGHRLLQDGALVGKVVLIW